MEIPTNAGNVIEGLPVKEMDALMSELLPGPGGSTVRSGSAEQGWDKMTLLTGGFVPVGSIFWARPPKLFSQQKIIMVGREVDACEDPVESAGKLLTLATELFYVREGTDFRPATAEEIGGDAVGLDVVEIRDVLYKLMGMSADPGDASGNA
jgi:hypothetical protein